MLLQLERMLSLAPKDAEVAQGFARVHPEGKAAGFGFMFRSPCLWEDVCKSITLCNCAPHCLAHTVKDLSTCQCMTPAGCRRVGQDAGHECCAV